MGANYLFEVKNIEIWVSTFFKHNNSSVATMIHVYFDKAAQIEKVEFAYKNYDLKKIYLVQSKVEVFWEGSKI